MNGRGRSKKCSGREVKMAGDSILIGLICFPFLAGVLAWMYMTGQERRGRGKKKGTAFWWAAAVPGAELAFFAVVLA